MGKKGKSSRRSASSRPKVSPPRPSRSPPPQASPSPPPQHGPLAKSSSPSSPTRRGPPTSSPCPRRRPASSPSRRGTPPTPSSSPRQGPLRKSSAMPSSPTLPLRKSSATPASPTRRGSPTASPCPRRPPPSIPSSPSRRRTPPTPSSSPRGTPSRRRTPPTPSSSPRGTPSRRRTPPTPSSSPRGTQAPSPSLSPSRRVLAPSPSPSPPRGAQAQTPLSSFPKVTPTFDIFMDDVQNSMAQAFDGVRDLFNSILKNDHLLEGKLVTKIWGSFMIRIFSSAKSTEDPVCALYRTQDLYLDSVLSNKKWYRFKDHQAILPQEIKAEGSVNFEFSSKYEGLKFNPDIPDQIKLGDSEARKVYETLQRLEEKHHSSVKEVKEAVVLFVLLAEALRFPAFERWLLIQIVSEEIMYIPIQYTVLFRKWGKLSTAFHDGRDHFSDALEIVKEHCKTYDDVCALLGIVNRINWRKKTKATKKKKNKKKKKQEDCTEEVESSSNNKRRKMKI